MAMATHFYGVFTHPTSAPTMRLFLQSPQQVRISLSGKKHMRISWTTLFHTPVVYYGTSSGNYTLSAKGSTNVYHYLRYTSGHIHDVVIGP
ncbi:UNVERIFIED_CONTAM: Purple acid phosphatase 21 [Sesamum radiatum]|uniref:Purple acid phosphatase 21 n=1 Tax=Sesamum radiatum TaxID=300843 RepID=A0AAW2IK78_SESRA